MNATVAAMTTPKPWYKQFYPWMLISIPFLTVVGCIVTISLAISSPNALVKDNYYKEGLAINRDIQRQARAAELHLEGLLRGDSERLSISLTGDVAQWPESLEVNLSHATREDLDRRLVLTRQADGQYVTDWALLQNGAWYYHLTPPEKDWELRNRFRVEGVFQVRLSPQL